MSLLVKFWRDANVATAIEYGLIAAGISVAIIAVVNGLGTKVKRHSARYPVNSSRGEPEEKQLQIWETKTDGLQYFAATTCNLS